MACDITIGRDRACKDGLGGNSTLYLYNELADAFTVLNGEATAMNVLLTAAFAFPLEGDGNNLLAAGYPQAVVVDRNGNHHAIGLDDGIDFTVLASTGGAKTDMNGYTLTGVATTTDIAPILDDSTVLAFEAVVS